MSEVQEPTPINEEVKEVATTPAEPKVEQPASIRTNVLGTVLFSLTNTIYTWQPVGLRIVINVPAVTDNVHPLFALVANPLFMHPYYLQKRFGYLNNNYGGIFINNVQPAFTPNVVNTGVKFTWYNVPCITAMLALFHRKWRGDISFMLKTTGSFVNYGVISASPSYGATIPYQKSELQFPNMADARPKVVGYPTTNCYDSQMNATVLSDISSERHMQVTIPYRHPQPWFDQFQWLADCMPRLIQPDNIMDFSPQVLNCTHSLLNVAPLNGLGATTPAGGDFIAYEVYMKVEPGFQFADRHVLPNFWYTNFNRESNFQPSVMTYPRTDTPPTGYVAGLSYPVYGAPPS